MTFGEKAIAFYHNLDYTGDLPPGLQIMNPFRNNPVVRNITREFYMKFFADNASRRLILGINPGRFGGGATGIPFTDTIRLNEKCGIPFNGFRTYEPSSSFMYEMIDAFGGANIFYKNFFISAICPLGFTVTNNRGKEVNYNYYDSSKLTRAVYGFILDTLKQQLDFGIDRAVCFCLGMGKNKVFLQKINDEHKFFKKIIALEHPRYIMQYKARSKDKFINKYLAAFDALIS
jgi:hypothetical protein